MSLPENCGHHMDAVAFPPICLLDTEPLLRDSGLTMRDVTQAIYEAHRTMGNQSREARWLAVRMLLQRKVMEP